MLRVTKVNMLAEKGQPPSPCHSDAGSACGSAVGSVLGSDFENAVIYCPDGSPLLVDLTDRTFSTTAWLPMNDKKDYQVQKNNATLKEFVTSPFLGIIQYVAR